MTDFDLLVIGAGPAGLSASIYGATEGLRTLVLEPEHVGGQSRASTLIENVLGWTHGFTGVQFADASKAQAQRFGAVFDTAKAVQLVTRPDGTKVFTLSDGRDVSARAATIATGAQFTALGIDGETAFFGKGVSYGQTPTHVTKEDDVYIIGGANSAGQSAMFLSERAHSVTLLVRRDLSMSDYLLRRIEATENIRVIRGAEAVAVEGDESCHSLVYRQGNELVKAKTSAVCVFIGARPATDWLAGVVERTHGGHIMTGADVKTFGAGRSAMALETSVPGLFAAGDVRYGSVKRVIAAAGEGAYTVSYTHQYLS